MRSAAISSLIFFIMLAIFSTVPARAYVSGEVCATLPPVAVAATGEQVPLEALAERIMSDHDALLVGESHGEQTHVLAFVCLLRAMDAAQPILVLEHLDAAQQTMLTTFRKQFPETVSGLANAIDWAASGWPAWVGYRPLFAYAWTARLTIDAGDLGDEDAGRILASPAPIAENDKEAFAAWSVAMHQAHCGLIDSQRVMALASLQIARDSQMARRLEVARLKSGFPVLFAGRAHVRLDRSVPRHLDTLNKPAVLGLVDRDGPIDTAGFEAAYTYVWPLGERAGLNTCARLIGEKKSSSLPAAVQHETSNSKTQP